MTDDNRSRRFVWHEGDTHLVTPGKPRPPRPVDAIPPRQRGAVSALAGIRQARDLTQQQLAELMNVNQAQVSRLERRDDFRVSSAMEYLAAVGVQRIELHLTFGDGTHMDVPLQLGDVVPAEPAAE